MKNEYSSPEEDNIYRVEGVWETPIPNVSELLSPKKMLDGLVKANYIPDPKKEVPRIIKRRPQDIEEFRKSRQNF